MLTPQPRGPQGFTNPLWVDNIGNLRSEKILIESSLNTNFTTITRVSVSIQDSLGLPTYTNLTTAANITLQDSNRNSNLINTTGSTSTNISNNRQLLLNDGANPTIKMVENNTPAHFTIYDIDTLGHNGNFGGNNFTISTDEDLILTSDNLNMSSSTLGITTDSVGYTSNPSLLINNTNAAAGNTTGVPSIELTKSGRNGANYKKVFYINYFAFASINVYLKI